MDNSKRILEALKMQPLSEEEKAARHILGRLYGPIATCKEKTRNGRGYNKELWERALADEVFNEKVANKSLFLELGHPVDREETDMEKVCACIPELPKIVDGDLYAYVDILDTKNGRTLKTLCDYGFIPGISSRGSGDVLADDSVDPETFFLETWDIVQLPAVKKARLAVCESLDSKNLNLKKALAESYKKATKEDKKLMKEALDNLNLNFNPEDDDADVPYSAEEEDNKLLLEKESKEADEIEFEDSVEDTDIEEPVIDDVDMEYSSDDEDSIEIEDIEDAEEEDYQTLKEFLKEFKNFDDDLKVEFMPLEIDGLECPITDLELIEEDDKLVIGIKYELPTDEESDEDIEDDSEDEPIDELEDEPEEDIDDVADDVIESLKKVARQKEILESEVKKLKDNKAVSDTEVEQLKEDLNKYKSAFRRVSELASKASNFEKKAQALTEEVKIKDATIRRLKTDATETNKLVENYNRDKAKIASSLKNISANAADIENENRKLAEQLNTYKKQVADRTQIAKNYKIKFEAVLNKYLESKASMLGVRPSEITRRLDESYTLNDIDKVCDEILTSSRTTTLPYGINPKAKVKINESVDKKVNPAYGYDIDDSLLELAGLK